MPSTPLYTVIAHENGTVTFELSENLFQQALKEVEAQRAEIAIQYEILRTARNDQYQLFLIEDLPKEGEPAPEHAIYLGKDDYIIYDDYIIRAGMKRQLCPYPNDWSGMPSKEDLKKTETKSLILDTLVGKPKVGTPQSVTLEKYVDAYLNAHSTRSRMNVGDARAESLQFYHWTKGSKIPPKEDLAWHENDLARRYKNYFLSRSNSINKPEVITPMPLASGTHAEVSSTSEPVAPTPVSKPISESSSQKLRASKNI